MGEQWRTFHCQQAVKSSSTLCLLLTGSKPRERVCFAQLACQFPTSSAGEDAPLPRFVLRGTPNGDDGKWLRWGRFGIRQGLLRCEIEIGNFLNPSVNAQTSELFVYFVYYLQGNVILHQAPFVHRAVCFQAQEGRGSYYSNTDTSLHVELWTFPYISHSYKQAFITSVYWAVIKS